MLNLIKFKLLLKKYKNVFSDILGDMNIKDSSENKITFTNPKGNELVATINETEIIFIENDKRYIKVIMPNKDEDNDIKVIDIKKEERPNGCIIEVIDRYYGFTRESADEKVLVDLISKRYVFDRNIKLDNNTNYDELCKMKTIFESHLKTLVKLIDSVRYYEDSPYSTKTLINGNDISYIYDIVNGIDKIYRIFDLYNGIINERNGNDILSIHYGLLRKEGLGYKEQNGITQQEDEICGKVYVKSLTTQETTFINNLIKDKIGYKEPFDIHDINSILNAITYHKTSSEIVLKAIERDITRPGERLVTLDDDEQHKNKKLKGMKKILNKILMRNGTFI